VGSIAGSSTALTLREHVDFEEWPNVFRRTPSSTSSFLRLH